MIEIDERIGAHGDVVEPLDEARPRATLAARVRRRLSRLRHRADARLPLSGSTRRRSRESRARSASPRSRCRHEVSPLMKLVARGDTTVVDAYLSPDPAPLRRAGGRRTAGVRLHVHAVERRPDRRAALPGQGRDPVRSGRRHRRHGAHRALAAGFDRVIGFDMGGTSTDVSHLRRRVSSARSRPLVAGVRMRAPMMSIHTVAAGGGSILHFDGARLRVGPGLAPARTRARPATAAAGR